MHRNHKGKTANSLPNHRYISLGSVSRSKRNRLKISVVVIIIIIIIIIELDLVDYWATTPHGSMYSSVSGG